MDSVSIRSPSAIHKLTEFQPSWTNDPPDRAQWEWRRVKRSFGYKRRTKLIDDLRKWNEDLRRCLEKAEVPAEDESRRVQNLKDRFNPKRCTMIRERMRSLHRALGSSLGCACSLPHVVTVNLDWTAYEKDMSGTVEVAMSYRTEQAVGRASVLWRKFQVTPESIKADEPKPQHLAPSPIPPRAPSPTSSIRLQMADLKVFRSILRSRTPPSVSPASDSTQLSPTGTTVPTIIAGPDTIPLTSSRSQIHLQQTQIHSEIHNLCVQMNRQCQPWTLSGFLSDPTNDAEISQTFSLNHVEKGQSAAAEPLTLKTLIASQRSRLRLQPHLALSVKQRRGIAAAMAWSVLHLSGSPWLGEQWAEKQAKILVERSHADREILARHPCISCFFPSLEAPPSAAAKIAKPDFAPLIPDKSVFDLGILLIELCINKPLVELGETDDRIRLLDSTTNSAASGKSSPTLLDDYSTAVSELDQVRLIAGDSYGNAVERCIKFVFQGLERTREFDHPNFRREFYNVVIAPIQATYLMMPETTLSA